MKRSPAPSMVYPQISTEEWANRYDLSLEPGECDKCGELQYPTIPFATRTWRGLLAPIHGCGERYRSFLAMEVGDNSWAEVFKVAKESLQSEDSE